MAEIRVFHSHIEIYPYNYGDCPRLEKMLSKFDNVTHKYIPIGYYIQSGILYIPRGINLSLLQSMFNTIPTIVNKCDDYTKIQKGTMKFKPKNRIQEESIDFLTSQGKFKKGEFQSQFGLNLDTGDGKTYCMINAILKMKLKAIVITHKQKIKEQWIETILNMSSVEKDSVCDISGSDVIDNIMKGKIKADIYCVNHQTLNAYARVHGWESIRNLFKKIKVGVKVVDEAHKFFENSLMIDFFSNVKRSYYLTATFTRSDPKEIKIFKIAYDSLYRFGEETMNYEEKRKHIVFIVVYYHSYPTIEERRKISTSYGFSSYRYIDYALNEENNSMMKVLKRLIEKTENMKGKTLVISPKTDSVDYIAKQIEKFTDKSVGTVHSKNNVKQNENGWNSDIISSTIKSIGEGDDIKGLRILINLEPIGSKSLADQLRGRLREYSKDDDTFMFYPVDTSIKETYEFLKRIMPVMKKKCKEIIFMRMDDI